MFTKVGSPIRAIVKFGKAASKSAAFRYVAVTSYVTLLFLGTAQPAQAATVQPQAADAPNIMCFIGVPTLSWLDPAKPQVKTITGIVLGILILAAVAGTIIAAIKVAAAGKHSDKAADGLKHFGNVILSLIIGFGGLIVVGLLIGILVALFNFQTC